MLCVLVIGGNADAGQLRRETVPSAALGREMPFMVYVPDGYAANDLSYPVLYLLHGAGGDENAWPELGQIQQQADRLIASGAIPPTLIVMPGCRTCWWIDGRRDKAETAFWEDLLPAVASRFRTIETREGRMVAGLSAGGYGAVRFAMKYPDRIGAVAALSPAIYAVTPPEISSARSQPPFLDAAGKFDQSRWAALNYPSLADSYFKQQHKVPFYLVSGTSDRFGIAQETISLFKLLLEKQPDKSELRMVDGDHSWTVWANAIDGAMRFMYRHAARPMRIIRGTAAAVVARRANGF